MDIKDQFVVRSRRTASRIYNGSAFIILLPKNSDDPLGRQKFILGKASTVIWRLIEDKTKVRHLIRKFSEQERIRPSKELEVSIVKNLSRLIKQGLVEIVDKGFKGYLQKH